MKKLYKLGLASVLALSLAACSSGGTTEEPAEEPEVGLEEGTEGEEGLELEDSEPVSGDIDEDADAEDADAEAEDADAEVEESDDATAEDDAAEEEAEE